MSRIRPRPDARTTITPAVDIARGRSAPPSEHLRDQSAMNVEGARTQDRPAVTVVIATCRRVLELERTLRSILATGYEPLEVIVVENRPPADETRALMQREFSHVPIRYVEEPRRGGSAARNAGLANADGEIVAFTDDDVVVDRAWITNALQTLERNSDVACVTGRILPLGAETPLQKLFSDLSVFDKGPVPRVFRMPETRVDLPLFPYVAGHIGSGANIVIRREVAQKMGGFDPMLGPGTPALGGEDLDLFIRLVLSDYTIVYDPSVIIFHDNPNSVRDIRSHAYHYGVGFTAMLTKQLVYGPRRLDLLRAIPSGTRYLFDPASRKNAFRASSGYPRSLEVLEYLGMAFGPVAYLGSTALSRVSLRCVCHLRKTSAIPVREMTPAGAASQKSLHRLCNPSRPRSRLRASLRFARARPTSQGP